LTWGSAALHPRLYALARYRGLVYRFTVRGAKVTKRTNGRR